MFFSLLIAATVTVTAPPVSGRPVVTIEVMPFAEIAKAFDATDAEMIGFVSDECQRRNADAADADIELYLAKRSHRKMPRALRRSLQRRVADSPAYSRACLAATTYTAGYRQTHRTAMDPVVPLITAERK